LIFTYMKQAKEKKRKKYLCRGNTIFKDF